MYILTVVYQKLEHFPVICSRLTGIAPYIYVNYMQSKTKDVMERADSRTWEKPVSKKNRKNLRERATRDTLSSCCSHICNLFETNVNLLVLIIHIPVNTFRMQIVLYVSLIKYMFSFSIYFEICIRIKSYHIFFILGFFH